MLATKPSCTVCVWKDEQLIASVGGMPRKVLFFGQPQTSVQIGDSMVDASKRGILTKTGAFFRMNATFFECCVGFGKPFLFAFGFPSERALRLADHLNLYQEVGRLLGFSWPNLLKNTRFFTSLIEINATNITRFSLKINRLWLSMAADLQDNIVGIRDAQYILNRYLQHPENEYRLFLMRHKLTRKVTGLIVLHVQDGRCSLIDLITPLAGISELLSQARYLSNFLHCERLFCQISNTFAEYFKTEAYQQEDCAIPISTGIWAVGPDPKDLVNTLWLMSGDMDFK